MSASRVMFIAAVLTLFGATAGAADAVKAKAYATREQLRECMDLEAALKTRIGDLKATNAANDVTGDRLDAEGKQVNELKARLDRNDAAAVTAFKQQVTDHNEHVAAWKKASDDAQSAADSYNADSAAVDQKCLALAYHTQDMDAVMKERKKAAAASAAKP